MKCSVLYSIVYTILQHPRQLCFIVRMISAGVPNTTWCTSYFYRLTKFSVSADTSPLLIVVLFTDSLLTIDNATCLLQIKLFGQNTYIQFFVYKIINLQVKCSKQNKTKYMKLKFLVRKILRTNNKK